MNYEIKRDLFLLSVMFLTACARHSSFNLSDYGLKPDTKENAAPLIAKALQEIMAEEATLREYYISNHDQDNPKRVGRR